MRRSRSALGMVALWCLMGCAGPAEPSADGPRVLLVTGLGEIEVALDAERAPITTANFLAYVEAGFYDGGCFHRTVTLDNQPTDPIRIQVIQAGVDPRRRRASFPSIPLERTNETGVLHVDGTISMARGSPDSGRSDFFLCIEDQPSLDFGGLRNPDGQGFAAFGRVVRGMEVVRAIQACAAEAQRLTPPILIEEARRIRSCRGGRADAAESSAGPKKTNGS